MKADPIVLRGGLRAAATASFAFALLWLAVGLARPHTTFHLAPPLVAAAAPVAARVSVGRPLQPRRAGLSLFVGSTALAVVAGVLGLAGALSGPSLLPAGGAPFEVAVGAVAGAAYGLWAATRRRAPWYLTARPRRDP